MSKDKQEKRTPMFEVVLEYIQELKDEKELDELVIEINRAGYRIKGV